MSRRRPPTGKSSANWSDTVTLPVALTLASTTPRLTATVVGGGASGLDCMTLKLPTSRDSAVNPSTPCMSLVRIIGAPLSVGAEARTPGPKARGQTSMSSLHGSPAARSAKYEGSPASADSAGHLLLLPQLSADRGSALKQSSLYDFLALVPIRVDCDLLSEFAPAVR